MSESDEESIGGGSSSRILEWEVVTSDADSAGFSDSNGHDGQVLHERDVDVHLQHFAHPEEQQHQNPADSTTLAGDSAAAIRESQPDSPKQAVRDWIEPSTSAAAAADHEQEFNEFGGHGSHKQHDLDLLSSLVSSVLETGGKETDPGADAGLEADSLVLQREVLSEAGFSSLIPSDFHGNVLRPEEQEEGAAANDPDEEAAGVESVNWKQKFVSWKDCIKRASTLWSITIAAALMGLVIIGQRWHHERWQNHQLRLQLCYKDEKISQLLFQIARLKEAVSGRRRVPVIKANI